MVQLPNLTSSIFISTEVPQSYPTGMYLLLVRRYVGTYSRYYRIGWTLTRISLAGWATPRMVKTPTKPRPDEIDAIRSE